MTATPDEESFDIHSVAGKLRVTYPSSLYIDRDEICRSVPEALDRNSTSGTVGYLEIRIDDAVPPNVQDLRTHSKTILTVSESGVSSDDLRHLVHALLQRAHLDRGILTLYCVSVGFHDRALALLGAAGDGKTITSLAMKESGAELLAAELGLIDVKRPGQRPQVVGGSRTVMVRQSSMMQYFGDTYGQSKKIQLRGSTDRVDITNCVRNSDFSNKDPRRLAGMVFVKVSPVEPEYEDQRMFHEKGGWPAMRLWRASQFCFDHVVERCDYPLTLLQSAADIRHQWRSISKILDEVPIWNVFGSLEFVADRTSKILLSLGDDLPSNEPTK